MWRRLMGENNRPVCLGYGCGQRSRWWWFTRLGIHTVEPILSIIYVSVSTTKMLSADGKTQGLKTPQLILAKGVDGPQGFYL